MALPNITIPLPPGVWPPAKSIRPSPLPLRKGTADFHQRRAVQHQPVGHRHIDPPIKILVAHVQIPVQCYPVERSAGNRADDARSVRSLEDSGAVQLATGERKTVVDLDGAGNRERPARKDKASWLSTLLTLSVPDEWLIVSGPGWLMRTSSLGPGSAPVLQLVAYSSCR